MTRTFVGFAFCLVLLAGLGCGITDYGIITDNNQITGKGAKGPNPVLNTRGKAHIQETSQVATIWPDGSDETINFVDQKADGTAILTTFNNFSTGNEPTFHDDLYCNTDRQGCSIYTAPDNNDTNLFDYDFNPNCSGARSACILLATGRYYGECGRERRPAYDPETKVALFNLGAFATRFGMEGFLYTADSSTSQIVLTDTATGYSEFLPFSGAMTFWRAGADTKAIVDLRDARLVSIGRAYADWLTRIQPYQTEITFYYHSIPFRFNVGGGEEIRDRIVTNLNESY